MATDADCTSTAIETTNFNKYLSSCRKPEDTARANNFFKGSIINFKEIFQGLRAQYTDLKTAAESQNSILSLSGNTTQGVDTQIEALEKKKEKELDKVFSTNLTLGDQTL
jgi:hypothetical protein